MTLWKEFLENKICLLIYAKFSVFFFSNLHPHGLHWNFSRTESICIAGNENTGTATFAQHMEYG